MTFCFCSSWFYWIGCWSSRIRTETNLVLDGLLRQTRHDIRLWPATVYQGRLQSHQLRGHGRSKSTRSERRHHFSRRSVQFERFAEQKTSAPAIHFLFIRNVAIGSRQRHLFLKRCRPLLQLDNDASTRLWHLLRGTLRQNKTQSVVPVDGTIAAHFSTRREANSASQTDGNSSQSPAFG